MEVISERLVAELLSADGIFMNSTFLDFKQKVGPRSASWESYSQRSNQVRSLV